MDELGAVPASEWIWDGHARHLIVGRHCEFHLATRVGDYIVSTVGEYRGPHPDGDGEYREFETVGAARLFETFVFNASGDGFGEPTDYSEIDFRPANDHDTATANHMALCRKYAARAATDAAASATPGEPHE